ncbi:MAG: hypothetical protein GWN84_14915 [Gammaproteobacteria bacterium]|nr:hypothetical protein [Gammaproteobacteria bacterium]NIR84091.1 hypothetical protein [Gammaproteobacteria bacterium]NIR89235.1 hypothetical protein [Gammaproteobacteria bacterium]NIU05037.1 hypothetical protein [Gammaproteobacteria bacterium]NIV52203.1 hypothetical protein [Gammaproteobacteria bacterium]
MAGASSAAAQWQIVQDARVGAARTVDVAYVENDQGDVLQVYRDPNGTIRGTLAIGGGFERLATEFCPSYRVDERPPGKLRSEEGECRIEPQRAHFALGEVRRGRVRSSLLIELMNGSRVVFRYRLAPPLGYQESTFTLSGSRGALQAALGPNLSVVPR